MTSFSLLIVFPPKLICGLVVGETWMRFLVMILLFLCSLFDDGAWRHAQDLDSGDVYQARIFCAIPQPLRTVQRAENWCVILALQAFMSSDTAHAKVFGGVTLWLDGFFGCPLCLVLDDVLLAATSCLLRCKSSTSAKAF